VSKFDAVKRFNTSRTCSIATGKTFPYSFHTLIDKLIVWQ